MPQAAASSGLRLLSAGAAQGVASALAEAFQSETGEELDAAFMPVGAVKERLLAGERCDVVVSTPAMLEELARHALVDATTVAILGSVHAGVAVRSSDDAPMIDRPDRLRDSLDAAPRIHVPDPLRATAGGHFVKVLRALGLYETIEARLASHPSGAAAMAALASTSERGSLGCTQVTEIRYVAGVKLVGPLPAPFDLATAYAAAVSVAPRDRILARRFVELLTGPEGARARATAGFEART
jgi:molybdate transport system substrate-binding protein